MPAPYISQRFPWLTPPCDARLSLRLPAALVTDLQRIAAEEHSSPATVARTLLARAVGELGAAA